MSEKPARYWRADGGLQDVPRPPSPPPAHLPAMYCFPRFAPWCAQPTMYWQGPIPVGGIFSSTPPPPYVRNPPPPPAPAPPAPRKQEDKKKTEQKKNGNPYAAPSLADGVNYLFDDKKNHTMIHVFNRAGPVWNKEKYRNKKLKFKMFMVSFNFTIKLLIENVLKKGGDECKEWACTEAVERGDGEWDKGTTIEYDSDKAEGTLKSMGWSAKRGDSLPAVWLVVHQKDFKK